MFPWFIITVMYEQTPTGHIYIYHGTGFKCERVIIENCDFSPSAQLLECNVIHYAYTYVRTCGCNQYVARA